MYPNSCARALLVNRKGKTDDVTCLSGCVLLHRGMRAQRTSSERSRGGWDCLQGKFSISTRQTDSYMRRSEEQIV